MRLILFDRNNAMIEAWKQEFPNIDDVTLYLGDFKDIRTDNSKTAIISPANSFGFMDGGIDLAYSNLFGFQLQEEVQQTIKNSYNGELLIGQSFIQATFNELFPYIIVAPTMRIPMNIQGTINVYLATKSLLITGIKENIEYLLIPGMGTGAGQLDPNIAAIQMKCAYDEIVLGKTNDFKTLQEHYLYSLKLLGY